MASSGTFRFTTDTLRPKLNSFPVKFGLALGALMKREAQDVQDYARRNAPWQDQTGNARQGLFARHAEKGGSHSIVLYHTMPYGIWLEVRWAGKYAIIEPTIRAEGKRIMGDVNKLLAAMQ